MPVEPLWYHADSIPNRMPSLQLTTEVQYGEGHWSADTALVLAEKGIATVEDLLYYCPIVTRTD